MGRRKLLTIVSKTIDLLSVIDIAYLVIVEYTVILYMFQSPISYQFQLLSPRRVCNNFQFLNK